jgi:hypothetical protein
MPSLEYQMLLILHLGWQNGFSGGDCDFSLLAGYGKDGSILLWECPTVQQGHLLALSTP